MNNELLITFEILLTIVAPLIVLYLKGGWPMRAVILSLLSIPILWYFIYSPLHELSHVAGTYLAGGSVTYIKLIPSFWHGEFGRAWITTQGVTVPWKQVITTGFPYMMDVVSILIGIFLFKRGVFKQPFTIGLMFMLLCLRPTFDLVCETIAFITGDRGDFYFLHALLGEEQFWLLLSVMLFLAFFSIVMVIRPYYHNSKSISNMVT